MLVYGDAQFQASLSSLLSSIRAQAAKSFSLDLEELRSLLIQCGQLEQAVEDYETNAAGCNELVREISRDAAEIFYEAWAEAAGLSHGSRENARAQINSLRSKLEAFSPAENRSLKVKIPEGFAFYSLFPEQYCASALQWEKAHSGTIPRRVVVVGIRSIGTTLSAVVSAALKSCGWEVERLTVRPIGHPFQRQVNLSPRRLNRIKEAVIVDEGPGISGSSMFAVAHWLQNAGCERIALLPGHLNGPGSGASAEMRSWWERIAKFHTPAEDLRWAGRSLKGVLAQRFGCDGVADLSAGNWREKVFPSPSEWPGVCGTLERVKFRFNGTNPVLCKFEGFGCFSANGHAQLESWVAKMTRLATQGFSPEPIGTVSGFGASGWIEGQRLRASETENGKILDHIAQYIFAASGEPLNSGEAARAHARVSEMLFWNSKEALGEEWAERAHSLTQESRGKQPEMSYGDGRMAPWEWVRTAANQIIKTDCVGHDCDHTLIGKQSILWDVAGTIVEWDLSVEQTRYFLERVAKSKIVSDAEALRFFCSAFAAFRMGVMTLAKSGIVKDRAEQRRIERSLEFYKNKLARFLSAGEFKTRTCAPHGFREISEIEPGWISNFP